MYSLLRERTLKAVCNCMRDPVQKFHNARPWAVAKKVLGNDTEYQKYDLLLKHDYLPHLVAHLTRVE